MERPFIFSKRRWNSNSSKWTEKSFFISILHCPQKGNKRLSDKCQFFCLFICFFTERGLPTFTIYSFKVTKAYNFSFLNTKFKVNSNIGQLIFVKTKIKATYMWIIETVYNFNSQILTLQLINSNISLILKL